MSRHDLTDEEWNAIRDFLPKQSCKPFPIQKEQSGLDWPLADVLPKNLPFNIKLRLSKKSMMNFYLIQHRKTEYEINSAGLR